jgi:sugar phosphate isomerase/epimerase
MLAQFFGDSPPFDSLQGLAQWASALGYKAFQIPIHKPEIFDVERAATDARHRDELRATLDAHGLVISELAAHRAGHLLAVLPAFDEVVDVFAPPGLRRDPIARRRWAERRLELAIDACAALGVKRLVTFSGALAWAFFYPYPPQPPGLIDAAFAELAKRWRPLLDRAERAGVEICYELHPGEDLHDGATFERFLAAVDHHPCAKILFDPSHAILQHLDYLGFIDRYHARIAAFHVKDAEFIRSDRSGVYGGYQHWLDRPGRFRSLGDGQVDFRGVFSRLARWGYDGWATLEWECCLKHPEDGAREGAAFIRDHIIRVTDHDFDASMTPKRDEAMIKRILGS